MRMHAFSCLAALVVLAVGFSSAHSQQFTRVLQCLAPTPTVYCISEEPELSPEGLRYAYTNGTTWPPYYEWWPHVVVTSIDGTVTLPPVVADLGGWSANPAWSPNGAELAFVGSEGIWIVDLALVGDIAGYRLLPNTPGAQQLAWSLDGQQIAFSASGGIHVADTAGAASQLILPDGQHPSWGPGGDIVFVRSDDLWIRRFDGTVEQFTDTAWKESTPAWSPDGRWIAYSSDHDGNWDVWVSASTGGTAVHVTSQPADESHPSWSHDGKSLLYHAYGTNDEFWLVSGLPDWTVSVTNKDWGAVKALYR